MDFQNRSMTDSSNLPEIQETDVDYDKQVVLILAVVAFLILGMVGAASTMWWISKNRRDRPRFERIPNDRRHIPDDCKHIPGDRKQIKDNLKFTNETEVAATMRWWIPGDYKHITADFKHTPVDSKRIPEDFDHA